MNRDWTPLELIGAVLAFTAVLCALVVLFILVVS